MFRQKLVWRVKTEKISKAELPMLNNAKMLLSPHRVSKQWKAHLTNPSAHSIHHWAKSQLSQHLSVLRWGETMLKNALANRGSRASEATGMPAGRWRTWLHSFEPHAAAAACWHLSSATHTTWCPEEVL